MYKILIFLARFKELALSSDKQRQQRFFGILFLITMVSSGLIYFLNQSIDVSQFTKIYMQILSAIFLIVGILILMISILINLSD